MLYRHAASCDTQRTKKQGSRLYCQLSTSGELIVSEALADPTLAKRVAVHEGQLMTTGGRSPRPRNSWPASSSSGARVSNEQSSLAERVPEAGLGLVEVRPIVDLKGFEM